MHLSFALGELGLRMEEFFDMPWNEYLIKCFAWARIENNSWKKFRLVAWESMIGAHLDPKSLPKTIESFLPLGEPKKYKSKVSQWTIDLANRRMQEYLDSKKTKA